MNSLSAVTARIKLPWSKFAGEMHLPGHNFTGPGTKLNKRLNPDGTPKSWSKPVNRVDSAAYRHDLAYATHSDAASRIAADRKMINELEKNAQSDAKGANGESYRKTNISYKSQLWSLTNT